jgi:hypothetical protein
MGGYMPPSILMELAQPEKHVMTIDRKINNLIS